MLSPFVLIGRARVFCAALSRDGRHGDLGRGKWLQGLSTAVDTLNDTRSRKFARILHFPLAIGAMSGTAAESRETSRPRVVHGDRSYASAFESVLFVGRLLSTA